MLHVQKQYESLYELASLYLSRDRMGGVEYSNLPNASITGYSSA